MMRAAHQTRDLVVRFGLQGAADSILAFPGHRRNSKKPIHTIQAARLGIVTPGFIRQQRRPSAASSARYQWRGRLYVSYTGHADSARAVLEACPWRSERGHMWSRKGKEGRTTLTAQASHTIAGRRHAGCPLANSIAIMLHLQRTVFFHGLKNSLGATVRSESVFCFDLMRKPVGAAGRSGGLERRIAALPPAMGSGTDRPMDHTPSRRVRWVGGAT